MSSPTPRWFTDHGPGHADWYVNRFRNLAAQGADLAGEARLVDALVPPASRILDAGCGPGRVGAVLAERGHQVTGVDVDPILIEAARQDHPGSTWLVANLAELDLLGPGQEPFDAAVLAGNVMVFLGPGTETTVLGRVAAQLRPNGRIIVGFGLDRGYPLAEFDHHIATAGLRLEHRFAAWDLVAFHDQADFAVTVLRTPA